MAAEESLAYLSRLDTRGIRLSLGPITRLIEQLYHPEKNYETILIGGTNGKGSIAAMITSILVKGGFTVGLYTSPHLIDVRERIRVNNKMISVEEIKYHLDEVREAMVEEVTYFEFLTAMAFLHFRRKAVDIAVLEVGLGGRLDATNVVSPALSVISNISLEHRDYLGNRLATIAWEKGGIIKDGGLCITGERKGAVIRVLEGICSERGARLIRLGRDMKVRADGRGTFTYHGLDRTFHHLACSLKGHHQFANAALAIGAVEMMARRGFLLDDGAVRDGIRETHWEGRLEILRRNPTVLVDGAHNPAGASSLRRALTNDFTYERLILVFGVLRDKDYSAMLKRLAPLADTLILTKPDSARAMPPEDLFPIARRYQRNVEVTGTVEEAMHRALAKANPGDMICAAGSLYLVGQVKMALGCEVS